MIEHMDPFKTSPRRQKSLGKGSIFGLWLTFLACAALAVQGGELKPESAPLVIPGGEQLEALSQMPPGEVRRLERVRLHYEKFFFLTIYSRFGYWLPVDWDSTGYTESGFLEEPAAFSKPSSSLYHVPISPLGTNLKRAVSDDPNAHALMGSYQRNQFIAGTFIAAGSATLAGMLLSVWLDKNAFWSPEKRLIVGGTTGIGLLVTSSIPLYLNKGKIKRAIALYNGSDEPNKSRSAGSR